MSFIKLQPSVPLRVPSDLPMFEEAMLVVENSQAHRGSVYIRAGLKGYHVPKGDAEKFARAILESVGDPDNKPKEKTRVLTVVDAGGYSIRFINPQSHKETES